MATKKTVQKPRLTIKQQKFVKGLVEGKSGTQAALDAYDTTDYATASSLAKENIRKPLVKAAIDELLLKHNITPDRVTKKLSKLIDAEKTEIVVLDKGARYEKVEVRDNGTQVAALRIANRLLGLDAQEAGSSGNTYNFNFGKF